MVHLRSEFDDGVLDLSFTDTPLLSYNRNQGLIQSSLIFKFNLLLPRFFFYFASVTLDLLYCPHKPLPNSIHTHTHTYTHNPIVFDKCKQRQEQRT